MISIVGAGALLAGLLTGLAIGDRSPEIQPGQEQPQQPASEGGREHPPLQALSDVGLSSSSSKENSSSPDLNQVAQELLEMMSTPESSDLSAVERRRRLRELRPEMAAWFIGKFREATVNDVCRQMALELALSCGGPQAVAFFEELVAFKGDRNLGHYLQIAISLLEEGHLAPRPRQFPVSDSLFGMTRSWLTSRDRGDRRAALVLLGFAEPKVALPVVTQAATGDDDPYVRMAAIREMGRIGDAATLDYLRTQRDLIVGGIQQLAKPTQQGNEVFIVSARVYAGVVDDAIENLKERLLPKK